MLVLLLVLVVLSVLVIAVLLKENESLKAQHRAYVSAVNSVYDNHSNVIIGLQGEIEDLLVRRSDDQAVIAHKDSHIDGLVKELKSATEQVAILEKLSAEVALELDAATAGEFVLKTKLANTKANYSKVEAYALRTMKKSSPSIFEECSMANDDIYVMEDELNIVWFK